ncbi:DUF349 domain-containing protein [Cumulibacter manganitolerans]|uniref:DUF349 domain-containing protein n=1 Tax=Cumulibacter manganitolerans TaxID=1884992 RepID=UPI001297ABF3|nr:DUF349 domain-containing protein [Cumulibacter manganitolerans]
MAASNEWGRVDDDGAVYVRSADGDRSIGSWQAGTPEEGLAHFVRRFEDLETEVSLLENRLKSPSSDPAAMARSAASLKESLPEAHAIGDLASLGDRLDGVIAQTAIKKEQAQAAKAHARADAVAAKEALVAEAEQLATSTQWKTSGDRLRSIIDDWKAIKGVDRKTDDALWKRFKEARDAFGKARGAHFAALDKQREAAKGVKERIVAEAQALADSTDWGPTASRMKSLMSEWKAAGRATRDSEDKLWTAFREAQDRFFAARSAELDSRDASYVDNQRAKEALLAEYGPKIDPAANLDAAKAALRDLQERWEQIGHVPRDAMRPLEDRMRSVERRVREAEEAEWRKSAAQSNPLLLSMREGVEKAQKQLDKAMSAGDEKKIAEAKDNLAAKQQWLAEAEKSVSL